MLGFGLASPSSGKFPVQPSRIRKICIVDPSPDFQIIDILQNNYSCRLYQSVDGTRMFDCATGEEVGDDEEIVFYVNEFESALFNGLVARRPQRPVIGPCYIKSRNLRNADLSAPKSNRRIYCETMKDVMAAVNLPDEKKKYCLELIHYMGGHVRKEAYDKTNILVSNKASGEDYRTMVRIGMHKNMVRFSWVEECWQYRNRIDFNCFNPNLLSKHRLGTFEGLRMHFHCLQGAEYEDMKKHLISNLGSVVDVKAATHIIYSQDAKSRVPEEECNKHAKHVNVEWFWTSINAQHCMLESNYAFGVPERHLEGHRSCSSKSFDCSTPRVSLSDRRSSVDKSLGNSSDRLLNVVSTPDYSYSNEELEKLGRSPRVDKRLQVCRELLETETNYINALQLLVNFKSDLEAELAGGNDSLMPKNETAIIFGKVEPIIEVHEKIRAKIQQIIDAYPTKDRDVCEVFTQAARELERVYPPYINNYDLAKDLLMAYDEQNPRFHVFRKLKETNPDFKRNTVMELLIRPVQRLPSVILLMKEINKKSDKSGQVKAEAAATTVDRVLKKANEVRQRNDQHIEHLARFNLIDGVPAHLVCSKRSFESECEVISVSGTGRWESLSEGRKMMLMLFHDVIIVCKIRDESRGFGRLTRQSSLSSFHRKPYKFFNYIMVQSMRTVQMIEDERAELGFPSSPQSSSPQLYAYTIREDTEEASWIVEPTNTMQMANFNQQIHNRLFVDTGRDFIMEDLLPIADCGSMQTVVAVNKYLKRWYQPRTHTSTSFSSTISATSIHRNLDTSSLPMPPPSSTGIRRAISTASLSLTNRFMRHFSKSNLTKISEEQSGGSGTMTGTLRRTGTLQGASTSNMPDRDAVELMITPKRNFERKRLSQNTFFGNLQRTLSRKHIAKPQPVDSMENSEENDENRETPARRTNANANANEKMGGRRI
ncbi:hypothetical protein WR25_02727 isoform A [Diploscapter pachys]|uniref:DH domain-containing protein n=1 Tax=Diploscapter pachys TaxID=2018661 RepID=A0A2A2JQ86_9BILA|nr:hypothetical protein WR25_02727 isoform A [Diploscapter pachys]